MTARRFSMYIIIAAYPVKYGMYNIEYKKNM